MNEEPKNPYYFYDNYSIEDLEDSLKKKVFEMDSYKRWAERAKEEVIYIKVLMGLRVK